MVGDEEDEDEDDEEEEEDGSRVSDGKGFITTCHLNRPSPVNHLLTLSSAEDSLYFGLLKRNNSLWLQRWLITLIHF